MNTFLPVLKNNRLFAAMIFFLYWRILLILPIIIILMGNSYSTADYNKAIRHDFTKPVIFSASFTTTLEITGTPPIQSARSSGGGVATHMGKTSFVANSTVNFTIQPAQINGTATLTAANGDEFYTSFTGTTTASNGQATGNFVHQITGGTGRFADINGLLRATSSHDLATRKGTLTFEGEIDY